MKPKLYLTSLALSALLSTTAALPAGAWFGSGLYPGAYVFDAKRFADSVKETAQVVQQYTQELDKWKKKILLMTGVTGLNKRIDTAVKQFEQTWTGQSIVSGNSMDSTAINQPPTNTELINQPYDYRSLLLNEDHQANLDSLSMAQDILGRYDTRYQQMLDIAAIETPGQVGEQQKGTAIAALQALNTEDLIRLSAADTLRQITEDSAAAMQERTEIRQSSLRGFSGYDPYHPTEFDKRNAPPIENFGFLSTKQTE